MCHIFSIWLGFSGHSLLKRNMLTLPQNSGNRVSEDMKFQNFSGEYTNEPPLLKTLDPRHKP